MSYNFLEIEKKWQTVWFNKQNLASKKNSSGKKFYCLDMFPYPSASGLHVGHWKGYVFSDIFARKRKLEGYNVLHPMGWDAFGLPAENDAIKKGIHPKTNTDKNIANFKEQLKTIGAIYDWSCELSTTDPEYYKWTQWIFLQMFKHGLAYQENIPVNWCPKCLTGLANEEACGGECDRCGSVVEQKPLRQWVLKITKYADALNDDLDDLDWPEKVKLMQKNWIGRSEGTEIEFEIKNHPETIIVFTTRADTLAGATFIVLATDHDFVTSLTSKDQAESVRDFIEQSKFMTDMDKKLDKEKNGVFLGSYAINPLTQKEIPIFIANYVLKNYGTGAVMGVAAHDERDFDFAKKYNLPIIPVVEPNNSETKKKYFDEKGEILSAYLEEGFLINSGNFDGISAPSEATKKITSYLENLGKAKKVSKYKLRDWVFSRQRYWGEPIPLIHCEKCGTVPLPESELPLLLPEVERYEPSGTGESPLANIENWVNTTCPECKSPAKRETNTMPQWAGSCWYFLRYPDSKNEISLASQEALNYWMPVDFYVGGIEHAVLHLLYARFYIKFLHEHGFVSFKEPFKKLFNQGMVCMKSEISGRVEKMSKSKGNVVNPDDIVNEMGSDCLRMYMLFMGPPEQDSEWQNASIRGVYSFLQKLWAFLTTAQTLKNETSIEAKKRFHIFLKDFSERIESYKVNTAVSALMEFYNDFTKLNYSFDREMLKNFLVAISVMVPHFSSELLQLLLNEELDNQYWPEFDANLAKKDTLEIPIQINGKLRAVIMVNHESNEDEIKKLALEAVSKWTEYQTIKKIIIVKKQLISIVI